jgi:hypothetical protein
MLEGGATEGLVGSRVHIDRGREEVDRRRAVVRCRRDHVAAQRSHILLVHEVGREGRRHVSERERER